MKLRWTRRAGLDLLSIGEFIASDNPGAAKRWVDRLRQRARLAARMPNPGRRLPEAPHKDVREVVLGHYRIVYRVLPGVLEVLMVLESHRQLVDAQIDRRVESE